jgi:hypothetical protein
LKLIVTLLFMLLVPFGIASAQDFPFRGQLSAKSEKGTSIGYDCLPNGATLHCDFTQVMISHPTPMTQEQIDNGTAQLIKEPVDGETCEKIRTGIAQLKAGQDPDPNDPFDWQPLSGVELTEAVSVLEQFRAICQSPNETDIRAYLNTANELSAKSCNIGTFPFDLDFTYNAITSRWESVSSPQGGCGTITSAFWEKASDPVAAPNTWNYHQLRTVTLSTSTDPLSGRCADKKNLDMYFIWQSRSSKLQCENVTFSLF